MASKGTAGPHTGAAFVAAYCRPAPRLQLKHFEGSLEWLHEPHELHLLARVHRHLSHTVESL